MDKFVIKSNNMSSGRVSQTKTSPKQRFSPYTARSPAEARQARQEWSEMCKQSCILYRTRDGRGNEPQPAKSESEIRKSALTSLSHPGNPLTDRERIKVVEYVWSCATGHQQGDVRRNLGSYKASRNAKMGAQQEPARTTLFRGCVIYCDSGYCQGTTALELKKLVHEHGGNVSYTESAATHILTSQSLAGAKIQRFLTQNSRNKKHVIKPEWLFDSISQGKRRPEWDYTVIKDVRQSTLDSFRSSKMAE